MHTSAGVLLGHTSELGDLTERQLLDVAELERLAIGHGKRRERRCDFALRVGAVDVEDLVGRRAVELGKAGCAVERADLAATAITLVEADVGEDAVKPGPEVELTLEPRHRPIGPKERLLHRVFRGPGLAEPHHRVGIERRRVLVDDACERLGVAPIVGFDQQTFVDSRHRHRANQPSPGYRGCMGMEEVTAPPGLLP